MRLILPILLLTATAALAQSQPAPPDKSFIYDGPMLKDFQAPNSITIVPPKGAAVTVIPSEAVKRLPENSIGYDRPERPCAFNNPPPCTKPETLKPLPKGTG